MSTPAAWTARVALAASLALLPLGAPGAGAEPVTIELVRDGVPRAVPEGGRARIADRLPKLFETCSINSRDQPQIVAARAGIWDDARARDHLRLGLAAPAEMRAGRAVVRVRELLVGLANPEFPGPSLSRDGDQVVAYVKCSGADTIRFVCEPDIKPLMPGSYHRLCRYLPPAP